MSYRITKILNHNSFMGIESKNDQECLIMGKGVAFGKKVGQTVSVTGDARVYSLKELTDRGEAKDIIKSVSPLCLELANDVLEKAFLPAFYIPHILERSFLISLCMNGLESENEDIFYFGESPYEIYAAMCQFSVSVTKA